MTTDRIDAALDIIFMVVIVACLLRAFGVL